MTYAIGWRAVQTYEGTGVPGSAVPGVYFDPLSGWPDELAEELAEGDPRRHIYTPGSSVTADVAAELAYGVSERGTGIHVFVDDGYALAVAEGNSSGPLFRIVALGFDPASDVLRSGSYAVGATEYWLSFAQVFAEMYGAPKIQFGFSTAIDAGSVGLGCVAVDNAVELAAANLSISTSDWTRSASGQNENADISALVATTSEVDTLMLAGTYLRGASIAPSLNPSSSDQWLNLQVGSISGPSGGIVTVGVTVIAASSTAPFAYLDGVTLWLPER